MNYTESQIKKLEEWAKGLGYPDPEKRAFLVTENGGFRSFWTMLSVSNVLSAGLELLAILDKDLVFHRAPKFGDEYKNIRKSLEIFAEDSFTRRALEFLLNKVEAIEAKLEGSHESNRA